MTEVEALADRFAQTALSDLPGLDIGRTGYPICEARAGDIASLNRRRTLGRVRAGQG